MNSPFRHIACWGLAGSLTLLSGIPGGAAQDPAPAQPGLLETIWQDVQISGEVSSLYSYTDPIEGLVNPDNDIKQIETGHWNTIARTQVSYRNREHGFRLQFEPWISYERHYFDHPNHQNYGEENLQIGRYQAKFSSLLPSTTMAAQRGIVAWGPAFISSPSNPFPDSSSTANPLEEEFGTDFLWLSHAFNDAWSMSAYLNYSRGAADSVDSDPFQRSYITSLHYNGYNYNISILGGGQEDYGPIYGAYGQWTLNEAAVAYFDAGYRKRGRARYPVADSSSAVGGFYNQDEADRKLELVLGGSYTTKNDFTFYAEYLYQGSGYDNDELDLAHDLSNNARSILSTIPALANGTLGEAALNQLPYLGQHNLSLIGTKSIGDFDLTLQNQLNLQDYSGRVYGSMTYSHGPAKYALSILQSYGREGGAFRQDIGTQIVTGLMIRY